MDGATVDESRAIVETEVAVADTRNTDTAVVEAGVVVG